MVYDTFQDVTAASHISVPEPIMPHQKECPNTFPEVVGLSELCKGGLWQDKKHYQTLGVQTSPQQHTLLPLQMVDCFESLTINIPVFHTLAV